jgi:hypothetical protein
MATRPDARRALRAELAWGAAAVAATCILAFLALHLWDADLRVPFNYTADSNQNQMFVKGLLDHGWYQHNPDLGAPFGQTLYDFPVVSGDNLQMALMKGIGLFTSDSALVINLFFLLTFPLAAAIAYACSRLLRLSRPASALVAVLFALLPYHFLHGERHLFIAAYYAVPISCFFAVAAMRGDRFDLRNRKVLALLVVAVVVVGSAHVYYAAFAIALLLVAALVRVVIGRPRTAGTALALVAAIGVVVAGNHLPNLVYRAQHGANASLQRPPSETDKYGLKVAAMVLPVAHHRLAPLAHLRGRYDADSEQLQEGQPQALGIVATIGLLGLLATAIAALVRPDRDRFGSGLVLPLAGCVIATILVGTVGGFDSVFAYVVTPQLRAWGRIAIFVGFFSLLAVGLFGDRLVARRGAREGLALLGLILLVGFLDQTNAGSVPAYGAVKAAYRSDAQLVGQIERTLGPGASVFELPYEPFPEPQPKWTPDMGPYDMGRGYIHSKDLRWSYGLMKGRTGDWQNALVQLPPALVARAIAAVGFTGIYVDRGGYADSAAHLLTALSKETHARIVSSPNGRLAFLNLRGYAARVRAQAGARDVAALRTAVLRPLGVAWGAGFSGPEHDLSHRTYLAESEAQLSFRNPGPTTRRVTIDWTLQPAFPATATVTIDWPDRTRQVIAVPPGGRELRRTLTLPPGRSQLTLQVKGRPQLSDPNVIQPYYLRVLDPVVEDGAFAPFGPLPRDRHAAAWLEPFGAI